jgi:hypothetical protein
MNRTRANARAVIARFIAEQVNGPGAEPTEMMRDQADDLLKLLSAEGFLLIDPLARERHPV